MHLNVHSITYGTLMNGPGKRNMVHLQGCTLKCNGCFSTHTWSPEDNEIVPIRNLAEELLLENPEGITISGGEPMQQPDGVIALLHTIRSESTRKGIENLSILMYTGYTVKELQSQGVYAELSVLLDILVSGRYDKKRRTGYGLRGSANQKITIFSEKHTMSELTEDNNILEVSIGSDEIHVTGFPTKDTVKKLKNSLEGI